MSNPTNAQVDEFVLELGTRTRPHVVITDEVATFGFYADGRMGATQEWLDSKTDAELGQVVFDQISHNVTSRVITTS